MKKRRLTKNYLARLISEERSKLIKQGYMRETLETGITDPEKVKAKEVDADGFADSLEKNVDFVKALKIEESRLIKRLNTLREMKARAIGKISKSIW
jgi:hypothetical protein